jgi:hypothetical protein
MTTTNPATVPLAAVRAAIDAMEAYVPYAQRENARAHALAVSIGYAWPTACSPPDRADRTPASPGTIAAPVQG